MKKKKTNTPNSKINTANIVQPKSLKWFSYAILVFLAFIFFKQYQNADSINDSQDFDDNIFIINFWNGYYQEKTEADLLKKPFFIELNKYRNEWDFNLFNQINLNNIHMGKNNYLFIYDRIKSTFGDDYLGIKKIRNEVEKAKLVQQKLKEMGIAMLILFAPEKSSIYPEYLPDYIHKVKRKITNHDTYIAECNLMNINYIDFTFYFKLLKTKYPYPLYTQYGSHWSLFSQYLVSDTTIKILSSLMNINLPQIVVKDFVWTAPENVAYDMDLIDIPMHQKPEGENIGTVTSIGYTTGTPQKIILIGDSYARAFFHTRAMDYSFAHSYLWHYFNTVVSNNQEFNEVWELDLMEELKKVKAVVMLMNESNLNTLGNGFVDEAYFMFTNPEEYQKNKIEKNKLNQIKKMIRHDKLLLAELSKQSIYRGISMDSSITEKAIEILYHSDS